jgi:hypothetical protein
VWSTAQATIAAHGPPPVGFITLFAVSAVTVYWVLRAVTVGASPESEASVPGPGGWLVQAAAVAVPVGTMAVTARLLPSGVCWPIAGAVTVLGYLGVMGIGAAEPRQ